MKGEIQLCDCMFQCMYEAVFKKDEKSHMRIVQEWRGVDREKERVEKREREEINKEEREREEEGEKKKAS